MRKHQAGRVWNVRRRVHGLPDRVAGLRRLRAYTQGRFAYASNYTSGLRVYDTRDLAGDGLSEAAFFDIYPENDNATFEGGSWSNYPYFRQKGIVVSQPTPCDARKQRSMAADPATGRGVSSVVRAGTVARCVQAAPAGRPAGAGRSG